MADASMPQLGETVADGTVAKWFKAVGDDVAKGEPLFEGSTDKVDTEIPAPASGVLRAILVAEGVTVDVGTVLAVIQVEGEVPGRHHRSGDWRVPFPRCVRGARQSVTNRPR